MEDKEKKRSNFIDPDDIYNLGKRGSVFISHSWKDKEIALEIAHTLLEHDIAPYIDDFILRPGEDFTVKLKEARREAFDKGIFLVLLSPDSLSSDNVREELNDAVKRKANIIPIVVRDPGTVYQQLASLKLGHINCKDFTKGNLNNNMTYLIEWVKKDLGIKDVKKILVFVSYATIDAEFFKVREIAENLTKKKEITEVLYWQEHMKDNIIKYMSDNLGKCDVVLLFCSPNAFASKPVEEEWTAAAKLGKPIIPIFNNPDHIPPILTTRLGIQFDSFDFEKNIKGIYDLILKKIE